MTLYWLFPKILLDFQFCFLLVEFPVPLCFILYLKNSHLNKSWVVKDIKKYINILPKWHRFIDLDLLHFDLLYLIE